MIDVSVQITNPFPGLRSFNEDESHLFFGREEQVDELMVRLRNNHFIAVIGMSGSGKSSLIRAGLIPAIRSGFMTRRGSNWEVVVCRIGEDPIMALAKSLYEKGVLSINEAQPKETQLGIIRTKLERSENALTNLVEENKHKAADNVLIVIDQFEEIFQYKNKGPREDASAVAFMKLLLYATQQPNASTYVVLTMRSDFIDNCAEIPGLIDSINASQYIIPRMMREQLRMAVLGPLRVGGAKISKDLESRLLNDIDDNPDQLPILQHAMMRMWDYWQLQHANDFIEMHHYESIGTMARALSMHAEEAYHLLETDKDREIARKMFQAITAWRAEGSGVRKPTPAIEIAVVAEASMKELYHVFSQFGVEGRSFVVVYGTENGFQPHSIVDISHESIMRLWERLSKWVEDEAESAEAYLRLSHSAQLYDSGRSGLLQEPELSFALRWHAHHLPNEAWAERYDPSFKRAEVFLMKSRDARDQALMLKELEQKNKIKKSRNIAIVFGTLSVISMLFLVAAIVAQVEAEKNLSKAEVSQKRAEESRMQALKEREKAMMSEQEAHHQKEKAVENEQLAKEQEGIAKQNATLAKEQQQLAEKNAQLAKQQANIANEQRTLAEKNAILAKEQEIEALMQKKLAEVQREKADKLRMQSIAKTLSSASLQYTERSRVEDKSLLALQGFLFNQKHSGDPNDPTIYEALLKANELAGSDLSQTFERHETSATGLDISPDGKKMLSGSVDGKIALYDAASKTSTVFAACTNGRCGVRDLAFMPKNTDRFASSHQDNVLRVWDKQQKKPILELKGHTSAVRSFAFSHDGTQIASADLDGNLLIWDLSNVEMPREKLPLGERISKIMPWPQNTSALIATEKGNIYSFNFATSTLSNLGQGMGQLSSVAIFSNGKTIAAGNSEGKLFVIDLASGKSTAYPGHKSGITSLAISPDGQLIASGSFDHTVKIMRVANMSQTPIVLQAGSWVYDVSFTQDGHSVVFCSENSKIHQVSVEPHALAAYLCMQFPDKKLSNEFWEDFVGPGVEQINQCK